MVIQVESVKTTSVYKESTRVLCKEIKHYLRDENIEIR